MGVRPFQIHVEEEVLDDLKRRLAETRQPRVLSPRGGWDLGTSRGYLGELVEHWRTTYDWRDQEAGLNTWPQFKATVGDRDIHFVRVEGRGERPMPLLLLHGWPDSFYRYIKVIPRFCDPVSGGGHAHDSFDVVVPSLPGFAFTGPVRCPAPDRPNRHTAELLWRLMTEVLGYPRFAVAGGDGGSVLAQILAIDHPQAVMGIHLTDIGWHASKVDPSSLSKAEQKYLAEAKRRFMADGAYAVVQSTRPRSLSAGLNDSPVGLASWIVDRFHSWCDAPEDLEKSFGKDELLTNIMIYWVTQTIGSSIYQYYAEARSPSLSTAEHVDVPVALALFPRDGGGIPPRSFAERTLNVRRWTEMPRGGHFAALEEPDLFTRDVVEFFRGMRTGHETEEEARHVHPTV